MKLTIVVQGIKGSGQVPAADASVFFVRGALLDDQEISATRLTIDCTPEHMLTFSISDAISIRDGFSLDQLEGLWTNEDGIHGGPLEIEFKEYVK